MPGDQKHPLFETNENKGTNQNKPTNKPNKTSTKRTQNVQTNQQTDPCWLAVPGRPTASVSNVIAPPPHP